MFGRRSAGKTVVLESEKAVTEAVVALLARREYSQRELRRRIAPRVADEALLERVLARLAEQGYQSDRRCAAMLARQRVEQGYGRRRIRQDLRERGIDNALIEEALDELEVDWFALARQHAERRYGSKPPTDARERARRMRHLLGRGFEYDEVNQVFAGSGGQRL